MSNGLKRWMEGSAFRQGDVPQTFFHGTDADDFSIFTRWEEFSIGFHFGSQQSAQNRIDQMECENGRTIEVYCRAKSPLRMTDHHTWSLKNILGEMESLGIVDEETAELIYDKEDDSWLFAALEIAGYDCVVYENATEKGGDSIFLWDAALVKSTRSTHFNLTDPRFDPSLKASKSDLYMYHQLRREIEEARADLLMAMQDKVMPASVSV